MTDIKRKLLTGVVTLCVGVMPCVGAKAQFVTTDVVRQVNYFVQFPERLLEYYEEFEKMENLCKEQGLWLGNDGCSVSGALSDMSNFNPIGNLSDAMDGGATGKGAGDANGRAVAAELYSYLDETESKSSSIAPGQADVASAETFVRNTFYVNSEDPSEEEVNAVKRKRWDYIKELAVEVLAQQSGVRDAVQSNQESLTDCKKKVSAEGILPQISLLMNTKASMVRSKAGEIALQAKLLELEAAELLMPQAEVIVPETEKEPTLDDPGRSEPNR